MTQPILAFLVLPIFIWSDTWSHKPSKKEPEMEDLYYGKAVSLVRKVDTTLLINYRFDTAIMETGIFTYFSYDYPGYKTPICEALREAVCHEKDGQIEEARKWHLQILNTIPKWKEGLSIYSCRNGYLYDCANSTIIFSRAYEGVGEIDSAISIVKPYLANGETYSTKIRERFFELCIMKYGIEDVKNELENATNTTHFPSDKQWRDIYSLCAINLFGASFGIGFQEDDGFSIADVKRSLVDEGFYALLE